MAEIEDRIAKLERTIAHFRGGVVVTVVVLAGYFGATSLWQLPSLVRQHLPAAVTEYVNEKHPGFDDELRKELEGIKSLHQEAHGLLDNIRRVDKQTEEVLAKSHRPYVQLLGVTNCTDEEEFDVPSGTTDDWVVFGVNSKFTSVWEKQVGDNALFSSEIDIRPSPDKLSWLVNYVLKINFNTRDSDGHRETVWDCREYEPSDTYQSLFEGQTLQIVAVRK